VRGEGRNRRPARITFTLNAPARVVFTVRGPAPSCAVVGRIRVRGHAGRNVFRFTARIGTRQLAPGTYRIAARTRAGRTAKPVAVVVGNGPIEQLRCARPAATTASVFDGLATAFESGGPPSSSTMENDSGGLLPGVKEKFGQLQKALPEPPLGRLTEPGGSLIGLFDLALAALVLCGLALIAYAVRHVRRSRLYY
jgi:hypothetical protein